VTAIPGLLQSLGTTAEGLTEAEAALRLRAAGPNLLASRRLLLLRLLASRFRNPLIILLLLATALSAATGDATSATVIAVVVGMSVILDAVQEYRAGQAAVRLRDSVAVTSRVIRDGVERQVPAREIVPGDVVLLSAGDLVPADGRLLDGDDCFVNQAALTGEPYPVEKRPGTEDDALFQGSSVVSGWGRLLAVQTGRATTLGQIGQRLQSAPPSPEFERGARAFGLLILRLAILMVGFVVLVNLVRQRPALESFLFAIALAVGLTPELLPMVVSVTLARGALRMAARKVIVKRLAAIHDLGAMDLLCTDKTGTLTEGRIRLERHLDPSGRESQRVLELAWLNSHFESGLRSPMDDAILQHTQFTGEGWTKLDETPFDFERRRVAVLLRDASPGPLLVVKGALEGVLRLCREYEGEGPSDLRDLDADGDVDILWGDFFEPGLLWLRNVGSCRRIDFHGERIPFPIASPLETSGYNAPAFGDLRGKGQQDLVVGVLGGAFNPVKSSRDNLYQLDRTGPTSWTVRTSRLLNGLDLGSESIPAFADLDGDGDQDLLVGTKIEPDNLHQGGLYWLENTGTRTAPAFQLRGLLHLAPAFHYAPALGDLDGDGRPDLVLGQFHDAISYYHNDGRDSRLRHCAQPRTFRG